MFDLSHFLDSEAESILGGVFDDPDSEPNLNVAPKPSKNREKVGFILNNNILLFCLSPLSIYIGFGIGFGIGFIL